MHPFLNTWLCDDLGPQATITVRNDGRNWKVDLIEMDGDFYFCNQWESFVNHYKLESNNLVVFKYKGNQIFKSLIFDKTFEGDFPVATLVEEGESKNLYLKLIMLFFCYSVCSIKSQWYSDQCFLL